MVKIIPLKTKRQQALDLFGEKIAAHMAALFYRHDILNIPVQALVKVTIESMMTDGFDYWPETLEFLSTDEAALGRIEDMFILTMIEQGIIEKDFR